MTDTISRPSEQTATSTDVQRNVVNSTSDNGQENENEAEQNIFVTHHRFTKWVALSALSLVAWLATLGSLTRHNMDRPERWALTATTLTTVFSCVGVGCYVCARAVFMDQITELLLIGFIVILWSASLPTIMNPANSIAVGYNDYLNANLYFSSWFAFLGALWIAEEIIRVCYGVDIVKIASPATKDNLGKWNALTITSLITMGSSVRVFLAYPCSAQILAMSPVCRQTKFAISIGVIGTFLAMIASILLFSASRIGNTKKRYFEWSISIVLVILWSFGLRYVTFGSGPGENVGNLYFATWGSFTLSVLLASETVRELISTREQLSVQSQTLDAEDSSTPSRSTIIPDETYEDL